MNVIAVILKRDLRYIIYISINKIFTVYITELQDLIIAISIINAVKTMKLKL